MSFDGLTERQRMERLAQNDDAEWGWYVDDMPVLLAEIDRLRNRLGLPRWEGERDTLRQEGS